VDGVGAGVVAAGAVPQLCTPPWPRQAPLRVVPLKDEPSLHVAVTGAGVWANVASATPEQAIRKAAMSRLFTGGISHLPSGGSTDDCMVGQTTFAQTTPRINGKVQVSRAVSRRHLRTRGFLTERARN
jgi:hypothetical protein